MSNKLKRRKIMKNIFIGDIEELVELVWERISERLDNSLNSKGSNGRRFGRNSGIGYSDAVRAIMKGFAFDTDKKRAMYMLKRDADSDYYEAVIEIIQNVTFDCDKIKMISAL
jgi:hypothetical protein